MSSLQHWAALAIALAGCSAASTGIERGPRSDATAAQTEWCRTLASISGEGAQWEPLEECESTAPAASPAYLRGMAACISRGPFAHAIELDDETRKQLVSGDSPVRREVLGDCIDEVANGPSGGRGPLWFPMGFAPAANPVIPASHAGALKDVCAGDDPMPHRFSGILESARCDQEMYLGMASVAEQLGVECSHCHAPASDGMGLSYWTTTPKKQIANWMKTDLMRSIKQADGSPVRCKSCHTDQRTGAPVAKILGDPRDPEKAQEWMTMVMTNKFVAANGEKLRCKSCHAANYGAPAFKPTVILTKGQIPAPLQ